jgi:hypothetical protein
MLSLDKIGRHVPVQQWRSPLAAHEPRVALDETPQSFIRVETYGRFGFQ